MEMTVRRLVMTTHSHCSLQPSLTPGNTKTSSKMKHLLFFGIAFAAFQLSHCNTPGPCEMKYDEGQGSSFAFFMYYDSTNDRCNPFIYKGEGGNANRFKNERECMRNCSTKGWDVYPKEASQICLLPNAKGECNGNFLRYYYDPVHSKCKKFIWTGCIGNGNRFTDQNICNTTCAGIHVESDDMEEDEPDTPIAIICGVLLAAIAASIFITVIVLTLKSKKKSSKKALGKSKDAQADAPLQKDDIEMA